MITDANFAKLFIERVKEDTGIEITPEEAFHVNTIFASPTQKAYTILALQHGDITLLARLKIDKTGHVEIKAVRTQAW